MTPFGRNDLRTALYRIADGFLEVMEILESTGEKDVAAEIVRHGSAQPDLPAVLTVRETAELLRVSRNNVYEAVATKRIPSVRIGKRILIPGDALQKFLSPQSPGRGVS